MNSSSMSPQEFLKVIPGLIFVISSICFILGLIIVNVHLAEYGIYSTEFIRTEYLLAGGVFVCLIAITTIGLHYAVPMRFCKILWKRKRYVHAVIRFSLGMFFSVFSVYLTLMIITLGNLSNHKKELWLSILLLYLIVLINSFEYRRISDQFQANNLIEGAIINKDGKRISKNGVVTKYKRPDLMGLALATLLTITLIALYALETYKYINTSFGGGNKESVYLSPSTKGLSVSKVYSLPLNESETLVGPLEVLTETDKEIIVLIPSEISGTKVAIRLNKDLFDAIQAIPLVIEPPLGIKWMDKLQY